jgi:tRNA A-37 threonylcarbamoyl transferase component Bud32
MPELTHQNLGPYRILELIGRGGMAAIYKAYHPATDRLVAVKVLLEHRAEDPQIVKRFEHEARVISSLEHSNIVPVYDFGRDGELLYLVMRYMRAGTVNDLIKRDSLTVADAVSILRDVASALDYAHRQDIIHRDIKPNNILVDSTGRANLTDFGLAKVLSESFDLTRSGTAMGTPAYMAPEQVAGEPVSPGTDVYALGVMLYEIVTGVLPFTSDSPMAVAMMHLRQELRPPREVNPLLPIAVEAVIERAMNKEPGERFNTAGEMAAALTQAVGDDPTILDSKASDRAEHATLLPAGSTLHLIELATTVAETRSTDQITPELRRALQRREREKRLRPWLAFIPWAIAGVLVIGLAVLGITLVRGSSDSRTSAAATATAVQALILQLSAAQTAIASGGGADAQSTLEGLQTQIAGASSGDASTTSIGFTATVGSTGKTATSQPGSTTAASTPTPQPGSTSIGSTSTTAPPTAAHPTATLAPPPSATNAPPPTSILPPIVNTLLPGVIPSLPKLLP